MQLEQAVIEYLKKLNPLSLHAIIYDLMVEGKINYHEPLWKVKETLLDIF